VPPPDAYATTVTVTVSIIYAGLGRHERARIMMRNDHCALVEKGFCRLIKKGLGGDICAWGAGRVRAQSYRCCATLVCPVCGKV